MMLFHGWLWRNGDSFIDPQTRSLIVRITCSMQVTHLAFLLWGQRRRLGRGRSFIHELSHNSSKSACPSAGGEPQGPGGAGGAEKAGQAGAQSLNPCVGFHEIYKSIKPWSMISLLFMSWLYCCWFSRSLLHCFLMWWQPRRIEALHWIFKTKPLYKFPFLYCLV